MDQKRRMSMEDPKVDSKRPCARTSEPVKEQTSEVLPWVRDKEEVEKQKKTHGVFYLDTSGVLETIRNMEDQEKQDRKDERKQQKLWRQFYLDITCIDRPVSQQNGDNEEKEWIPPAIESGESDRTNCWCPSCQKDPIGEFPCQCIICNSLLCFETDESDYE